MSLRPEILFEDTALALRFERSSQGYSLWLGSVLCFKSWPDYTEPLPEGLLFFRQGMLILRNTLGEVLMPEGQISPSDRQALARILTLLLPTKGPADDRPSSNSPQIKGQDKASGNPGAGD